MILGYVSRQVFSLTDGMIPDFPNKPSDVGDLIHDPFTAELLLVNPLQEVDVTDLVIQPL